jgi:transposase
MMHKTIMGVDLAQHVLQGCLVPHQGTRQTHPSVTRGKLWGWIARQPPGLSSMEAWSGAHDWARHLRALGHAGLLLAPHSVVPFRHEPINDPHDALALTADGLRPRSPSVPSTALEPHDSQALPRVREWLVQHQTAVGKHIKGLLLDYGVVIPQGMYRWRTRVSGILTEADHGLALACRDLL